MSTSQINLRFSNELLSNAKNYAQENGCLNLQEFIREVVREKVYENADFSKEYLKTLQSREATTFISDKEAEDLDNELERRANLE